MDKISLLSEITIIGNENCERCHEVKTEIEEFYPNIKMHTILFKDLDKEQRSQVRTVLNAKHTTLPAFMLKDKTIYNGTFREFLKEIRKI